MNSHFVNAAKVIPLGVCDSYRYWGPKDTIYINSAEGASVTDVEGRRYTDFRLAYGPIILGYKDERVDSAVRAAIASGALLGLSTPAELDVATLIAECVASVNMVRFANSGTEAVMLAIRIARAATRRDAIIIVEGAFHGLFDLVMWQADFSEPSNPSTGCHALKSMGAGIPQSVSQLVYSVPLNDIDALSRLLNARGDQIACILIEPILGNSYGLCSTQDYMEGVRRLCDEYGLLFIADEVKTGFRVDLGGAQHFSGVKPDLTVFAKAIANGYPFAAVGGAEKYMAAIAPDGVIAGGTYTGHLIGLTAARETIRSLKERAVLTRIAQYGELLQHSIGTVLAAHGVEHTFQGHASMFNLIFTELPCRSYRDTSQFDHDLYGRLAKALRREGILIEPAMSEPWFLCEAHLKISIEQLAIQFRSALIRALRDHL